MTKISRKLSIVVLLAAAVLLVWIIHSSRVETLILKEIPVGSEVCWLDEKGTVFVPPGKALFFNDDGILRAVWWKDGEKGPALGIGELKSGHPPYEMININYKKIIVPRIKNDSVEEVKISVDIGILILRENLWVITGRQKYQGSFTAPD